MSIRATLRPLRLGLHHKVVLPFLLSLVTAAAVGSFLVHSLLIDQSKRQTSEGLRPAVTAAQRAFYHRTEELKKSASVLANEVAGESSGRKSSVVSPDSLISLKEVLDLDTVALLDRQGKLVRVLGDSLDETNVGQLAEMFSEKAGVDISSGEAGLNLVAVSPIERERDKQGFAVVIQPLGKEFLRNIGEEAGASVALYFFDRGVSLRPGHAVFDREVLRKVLREGSQITIRRSWVMGEEALRYAPLDIEGSRKGVVAVSLPVAPGLSFSRSQLGVAAAGTLASLVLAFLGMWLVFQRLSRPLQQLTRSAMLISEGGFDQPSRAQGFSELRQLALWLSAVLEELRSERRRARNRTIRLSRKVYRLSRLHNFAQSIITSELKTDLLIETLVDSAIELVGADAACIMGVHLRERFLSPAGAKGWKQGPRENIMFGEGISGWAALTGEPLLLAASDLRKEGSLEWEKEVRAAIVVPLRIKEELVGILMVARTSSGQDFEKTDLRLLRAASSIASSALGNAWATRGREQTLRDTVQVLASTADTRCGANGHSKRVAEYTAAAAKRLGLNATEADELQIAATLHDIGKMQIPECILRKEKPSEEEIVLLEGHPQLGRDILASAQLPQPVLSAIAHHHEFYGGGGYPSSLSGDEIPLAARIIAVADAFEKMTSGCPSLALGEAARELGRQSGNEFDPLIVAALVGAIGHEVHPAVSPSQESAALLE
jgi:putative nucleotidyltransferase with HDIG domain